MTVQQIFTEYVNFLWKIFQFDMDVYTKWWMWAFLAIPAILYTIFFFVKWAIMTAPLWLPFFLALSGINNVFKGGKDACKDGKK